MGGCVHQLSRLAGVAREPIVVDPFFRDQFEMAKATPQYSRLIQSLPAVIACTEHQLRQLVKILCREMHEVFVRRGISIPPWRSKESLLSKWKLPAGAYPDRDRAFVTSAPTLLSTTSCSATGVAVAASAMCSRPVDARSTREEHASGAICGVPP